MAGGTGHTVAPRWLSRATNVLLIITLLVPIPLWFIRREILSPVGWSLWLYVIVVAVLILAKGLIWIFNSADQPVSQPLEAQRRIGNEDLELRAG